MIILTYPHPLEMIEVLKELKRQTYLKYNYNSVFVVIQNFVYYYSEGGSYTADSYAILTPLEQAAVLNKFSLWYLTNFSNKGK